MYRTNTFSILGDGIYTTLWPAMPRRAISATGFTVLGIVNMLLTMVINLIVWDKHSSFIGTIGLLICMFGGVMYQQSTSNKPKPKPADVNEVKAEEEQQKLLEMQRLVN
ncbi:GDP-mannose transporter GONST3-like protein [Tanacetum coccineum]